TGMCYMIDSEPQMGIVLNRLGGVVVVFELAA
ncbi:hypothetical protein LCGC14_3129080, partial [marine sediment metagenome]